MLFEHVTLLKEFGKQIGFCEMVLDKQALNLVITIEGKRSTLYPSEKNDALFRVRQLCVPPSDPERELSPLRRTAQQDCFFKSTAAGVIGTHRKFGLRNARLPAQDS